MKKLFLILVLGLLPYSAQSYEYNLIDLGGMMNPPPTPEINCIPKDSTGSKEALSDCGKPVANQAPPLPTLAYALNDLGEVVGLSGSSPDNFSVFYYNSLSNTLRQTIGILPENTQVITIKYFSPTREPVRRIAMRNDDIRPVDIDTKGNILFNTRKQVNDFTSQDAPMFWFPRHNDSAFEALTYFYPFPPDSPLATFYAPLESWPRVTEFYAAALHDFSSYSVGGGPITIDVPDGRTPAVRDVSGTHIDAYYSVPAVFIKMADIVYGRFTEAWRAFRVLGSVGYGIYTDLNNQIFAGSYSPTVVGLRSDPSTRHLVNGFWTDRNHTLIPIAAIASNKSSFPYAINDLNVVVGWEALYQEPSIRERFNYPLNPNYFSANQFYINVKAVAFYASTTPPPGGGRMSFYLAPFARFSQAFGVNNRNQVVGSCTIDQWRNLISGIEPLSNSTFPGISNTSPSTTNSFPPIHAFLWREGQMFDLNQLIEAPTWELVEARDINENGSIVGWGYKDGIPIPRAFLLIPNANASLH